MTDTFDPRRQLRDLPLCPHGSIGTAELEARGLRPADVIDFSASTNPLGPPPAVREALARIVVDRYPDDQAGPLRRALAVRLDLDEAAIVVGNGSSEVIALLALAFLAPGDRALVVGPTYGEYARAARIAGAEVVEVRATADEDFQPDLERILQAIAHQRPRLVFLGNPNNPTGAVVGRDAIQALIDAASTSLIIADEAYLVFADDPPDLRPLLASRRLLLLRSMTKDYGLAGLRLGYGLGPPAVVDALRRVRIPWSVNAAAQAAGLAALADGEHVARARAVIREARGYLTSSLADLGLRVYPSSANFLLACLPAQAAGGGAAAFRSALLAHGICVRDCTSFGLPDCIRTGVRTLAECERLVDATRQVLAASSALEAAGAR